MLVNVFYNPGIEGTKLEYGYRGTPTVIDLGFDAAEKFHYYEIEWHAYVIRWRVDGRIVHERVLWNPTPIPNLTMEFNVNLWHSRSKELAGNLDTSKIPAHTEIKSIRITQV
jgi:beta-glucanase (GH16 family)